MLNAIQRAAYEAHALSERYASRVPEAEGYISEGLRLAPDAYVACSFGKDSAVMLHLCLQQKPDISVRFLQWTESQFLHDFDKVIEQWYARCPALNLEIVTLHRESLEDRVAGRWGAIEDVSPTTGYFVGLRRQESKGRRISIAKHGAVHLKTDGMWRIAPLAYWTVDDIGAYVVAHDLPLLDAYAASLDVRTSSRVPRASVRGEMLSKLRMESPLQFEQLASMFPEVRGWV